MIDRMRDRLRPPCPVRFAVQAFFSLRHARFFLAFFQLLGVAAVKELFQPAVRSIVEELQDVGIRVWMLTGDSEASAMAVASRSGVLGPACAGELSAEESGTGMRPQDSWLRLRDSPGGRPRSFRARLHPRLGSSGSRSHLDDAAHPGKESPTFSSAESCPDSDEPVRYRRGQPWKVFRLASIFEDLSEVSSFSKAGRRCRFGHSPQLDCSSYLGGVPPECSRRGPEFRFRESSRESTENESESCDRSVKSKVLSKVLNRAGSRELPEASRLGRRRVPHTGDSESPRPMDRQGRRWRHHAAWADDSTDQNIVVEGLRKMVAADDTRPHIVMDLGLLLLSRFRRFLEGATGGDGLCLVIDADDLDVFLDNKDLQVRSWKWRWSRFSVCTFAGSTARSGYTSTDIRVPFGGVKGSRGTGRLASVCLATVDGVIFVCTHVNSELLQTVAVVVAVAGCPAVVGEHEGQRDRSCM